MLTARSSRPTLAIVLVASVLGVVLGTTLAFVIGGSSTEEPPQVAPAVTETTLPEEFFTVVLASIDADADGSREAAERRAAALRERGIDAEVLNSSDYGSLRPGYLVVFSGRFDSEDEARRHLDELRANGLPDGPNPYVREVSDPKR